MSASPHHRTSPQHVLSAPGSSVRSGSHEEQAAHIAASLDTLLQGLTRTGYLNDPALKATTFDPAFIKVVCMCAPQRTCVFALSLSLCVYVSVAGQRRSLCPVQRASGSLHACFQWVAGGRLLLQRPGNASVAFQLAAAQQMRACVQRQLGAGCVVCVCSTAAAPAVEQVARSRCSCGLNGVPRARRPAAQGGTARVRARRAEQQPRCGDARGVWMARLDGEVLLVYVCWVLPRTCWQGQRHTGDAAPSCRGRTVLYHQDATIPQARLDWSSPADPIIADQAKLL